MRAVVTGASSGIGAASVRALVARGWDVVAVARRRDRLAELAQETGATYVVADLTKEDDVAAMVEQVTTAGPVHALVNNAGGAIGLERIEDADIDAWRAMYELNVVATTRVTKALIPAILASGEGSVLFVTSTAAHLPYEGGTGYVMAKHAERALMQTLRMEHIKDDLRVIEIAPGMVHTAEFSLSRFGGDQARADAVYAGVAKPLVAEDIAEAIAWSLSLPHHINVDSMILRPVAQRFDNSVRRDS